MTFKPIHNFIPQIVKNIDGGQNIKERFLSLANANPNWKDGNLYGEGVNEVFKIPSSPPTPIDTQPLATTRPSVLDPVGLQGGVQRSSPIAPITRRRRR